MSAGTDKSTLFGGLPEPWPHDPLPLIQSALAAAPHKVWILDDDPTGTQTIAGLPVLTHWDTSALRNEFNQAHPGCFILTNSRGLTADQSRRLHRQFARNLQTAAEGRRYSIISRSDSTLRGHFPLETDTLSEHLGGFDLVLIAPYFEAGGRYTIDDVHYVAEGDQLIPAAETPFAQDAVFGYSHSHLKRWVEEKTEGRVPSNAVVSLSLSLIRREGPAGVERVLLGTPVGTVVIANAACLSDIEVVAAGVLAAESAGRRILARTAAAFVSARVGQRPPPLLMGAQLADPSGQGGLIVAGSYVPKTTAQLARLRALHDLESIELNVADLLHRSSRESVIKLATRTMNEALDRGRDTLVFTSRELVRSADIQTNLSIGAEVSRALIDVVQGLARRPRYLIAKGGITSSDVATQALGIKRAIVRGQILPGVPVWLTGDETRFPGLSYVVFPGNVGNQDALADAVCKLKQLPLLS